MKSLEAILTPRARWANATTSTLGAYATSAQAVLTYDDAKAACIEHAANETAALREECRAREWAEAEAMALVLSHEGTIERLTSTLAEAVNMLRESESLLSLAEMRDLRRRKDAFITAHGGAR